MIATSAPTYDELAAQLATCQETCGRLQKHIAWMYGVIANEHMDDGDKVVALRVEAEHRKLSHEGIQLIDCTEGDPDPIFLPPTRSGEPASYLAALARTTGKSTQSVGTHLMRLEKMGAVRKKKGRDPLTGKSIMTAAPAAALLTAPRTITFPADDAPARPGGPRQKCPECKGENVVELRSIVCGDCGYVLKKYDPKPVNPPADPADPPAPVTFITEIVEAPDPLEFGKCQDDISLSIADLLQPASDTPEREQIMDCGHSPDALHKIRGNWVCGLCPAPDKPARAGPICHDCEAPLAGYAARGIWLGGKAVLVCEACRAVREREATGGKSA